jgi:hypothetical protein
MVEESIDFGLHKCFVFLGKVHFVSAAAILQAAPK